MNLVPAASQAVPATTTAESSFQDEKALIELTSLELSLVGGGQGMAVFA